MELEERRFKRESLSLGVAILAIVISVVGLAFAVAPGVRSSREQSESVLLYLEALSAPDLNAPLRALTFAQDDSPAATFAGTVTAWRQAQEDVGGVPKADGGKVTDMGGGSYELCLPQVAVPLFPAQCSTVADVRFSQEDQITEFTIDGVLSRALVRQVDDGDLTADGNGPVSIYVTAAVFSADGSSVTVVYSLARKREDDRQYPVRFSEVTFQDSEEKSIREVKREFPASLGYWQTSSAVVQVPRAVSFMYVCWDGVQDDRGGCDWTYGMGAL